MNRLLRTRAELTHRFRDESGAVLLLVAASLVVFLLCAAFVVDIGNARQVARNYQNAADGAALAGAQELDDSAAVSQAIDFASMYAFRTLGSSRPGDNCSGAPAGEVPSGGGTPHCYLSPSLRVYVVTPWNDIPSDPTPLPGGYAVRQIHVKVCGRVVGGFSRVVGINVIEPCRIATAMSALGSAPCAVCVRGGDLELTGSGSATVSGSSTWVNSDATKSGTGAFSAAAGFYVAGTASPLYIPAPDSTDAPQLGDPLQWLPTPKERLPNWVPPYLPWRGKFTFDGTPTGATSQFVDPGIYTSIVVDRGNASQTLTLNPGFYVIREKFEITSDVSVIGNGVTIFFACEGRYEAPDYQLCSSSGSDNGGYFLHTGGGSITFSPSISASDPYHNLLFFFDRNNHAVQRFSGGSADVTGTIYGPGAQFVLGNGNFHSLFVADSVQLSMGGLLDILYAPTEQVPTYLPALIS